MPQIIKPTTIIREQHFSTRTEQGEVTVNLNLSITITADADGALRVSAEARPDVETRGKEYEPQIPDLEVMETDLIDFGWDVKE